MVRTLVVRGVALAAIASGAVAPARADDATYTIAIQGHRFAPEELELPAGKKITLTIKNLDAAPAEFESTDLNREKVVVGGGTITVFIGPLRPGSYEFFDDFNPDTTHGHIVAK
jgi:cupredoxin-like protein